jgi:hypothetical protein
MPTPPPRLRAVVSAVLVAAFASGPRAVAQPAQPLKLPQESPAATLSLDVGVTTLTVAYHRPALRGRDPWKDLGSAPVWRLGANEATTLTVTDPVSIGGKTLPAGSYALFARVGKEQWTLLFNRVAQQWGSYFHDEKQDALRFDVKVEHVAKELRREWFAIALDPAGRDGAELSVAWDDVRVVVPIHVDVDAIVEARIERTLKDLSPKDWDTRIAVAKYWCNRKENLEKALDLADEALTIDENPWTCEWKGRLLRELGDLEPALPLIEKALTLASAPGSNFPEGYREGLRVLLKEWREGG